MTSITIAKGERKKILSRFSNSLQMTYRFEAEPVHAGDALSGTVEVKGSKWIFSKPPVTQALARENAVEKGIWDTFYSVHVTPGCDVTITLSRKSLGPTSRKLIPVALGVAAVASVIMLVGIFQ